MNEMQEWLSVTAEITDVVQLTMCDGRTVRGILAEWQDDRMLLQTTANTKVAYAVNNACAIKIYPGLKQQMQAECKTGDLLEWKLTSGECVKGVLLEWKDACLLMRLPDGGMCMLSYLTIRQYRKLQFMPDAVAQTIPAAPVTETVQSAVTAMGANTGLLQSAMETMLAAKQSISQWQEQLRAEAAEVYRQCAPKLNSLNDALKNNQTAVKHGKTPAVMMKLATVSRDYPGMVAVLALLCETALLAGDEKYSKLALDCLQEDWTLQCYESPELLRCLALLSANCKQYDALTAIWDDCPNTAAEPMLTAAVLALTESGVAVSLPNAAVICDAEAQNATYLRKLLAEQSSKAITGIVRPESQPEEPGSERPKKVYAEINEESIKASRERFWNPPGLTVPEGKKLGFVEKYNEHQVGIIVDRDSKLYRFEGKECSELIQDRMQVGLFVYFTDTGVTIPGRWNNEMNLATDIEVPECVGYIERFYAGSAYGFLFEQSRYGKDARGLYFLRQNMLDTVELENGHEYRVSFQYARGKREWVLDATNVRVLEDLTGASWKQDVVDPQPQLPDFPEFPAFPSAPELQPESQPEPQPEPHTDPLAEVSFRDGEADIGSVTEVVESADVTAETVLSDTEAKSDAEPVESQDTADAVAVPQEESGNPEE